MSTESPSRKVLLDVRSHLAPIPRGDYIDHFFQVPPNASKVGIVLSFHKQRVAQLFLSLHSPAGFRGNRMNPSGRGDIVLELWATPNDSSEGAVAGPLPAGQWRAQIDVESVKEDVDYRLEAYAEFDRVPEPLVFNYPADHVTKAAAGWYKGELHCHSTESDGRFPVATVVQAAQDLGLDFLSLTDHFTISQWRKLAPLVNDRLAIIRACEITSHQGHANLHGIREWVDVYVDREGNSMDKAADRVHAQGGLFCINHAYSGSLAWQAFDFDWSKADMIEVYHNLEGSNNAFHAPLWDRQLARGHHVVGVAGVDSHRIYDGTHRLGDLVTWVYARELSEKGIIEGLRKGNVYLSRGPEMRFTASNGAGDKAAMWESLPLGKGPVSFDVQVKSTQPMWMFVFKNGYLLDTQRIEAGIGQWQTAAFADNPKNPAYYRIELHNIFESVIYGGIQWRDSNTAQVFSNPIWVGYDQMKPGTCL